MEVFDQAPVTRVIARIGRKIAAPCAALALVALAGSAGAQTALTLTDVTTKDTTNPQDVQCLIIGNSCPLGQQSMDYFEYAQGGGPPPYSYDFTASPNSPGNQGEYTVGYLESFVSRVFDVGIDVNTTNAAGEMLNLFEVFVNDNLVYYFNTPTNIGAASFNGNGYFDWLLRTVDLTGYASTDVVKFHAVWDNATDGPENFFVKKAVAAIPEPGTYALMLAGLGVVGFMARRRKQQA